MSTDTTNAFSQLSQDIVMPEIYNVLKDENIMTFTLANCNVSVANAIRRTILSDIPVIGIRTIPYDKNDAKFHINTSRINNDILKQRLSCIPVNLRYSNKGYETLQLVIDVKNDGDEVRYVTTDDFKLIRMGNEAGTGSELTAEETRKLFPPSGPPANSPILFTRLRPKLSSDIPGEEIKITATFSLVNAKIDGTFNAVSCATFSYSQDVAKQKLAWGEKLNDLQSKNASITKEEIDQVEFEWKNHEAKRITLEDHFDFRLETLGIYNCEEIIKMACQIIEKDCEKIKNDRIEQCYSIVETKSTITNGFDIILKDRDYTMGKLLEYVLHEIGFKKNRLSFVGFVKVHPHDKDSLIRLAFAESDDANLTTVQSILHQACNEIIQLMSVLQTKKFEPM